MQGIVIAGTHSGCGKTTVTLGIHAALKKQGLTVQPFKTGPDFIDAGLHKLITGRPSRNLDLYMCGEDYVKECFQKYSSDADISVVEGVMGLYDGKLSTAHLSGVLNLPVILVVDAYGMAESAGAVVKGFAELRVKSHELSETNSKLLTHDSKLSFSGVIFNRVASENHFKRLKDSVQDVPVLGYLPRDIDFEIPHRHLGLHVAEENPISAEALEKLADVILKCVDVEKIVKKCALRQAQGDPVMVSQSNHEELPNFQVSKIKVAVAYDKAFCFYYEDNLDLLREAGAEIVFFSPLSDRQIPDGVDALYIGGGYPEIYATQLSENKSMLRSVKNFADEGKPVYAECGGFMYLTNGIWKMEDGRKTKYEMTGVFPFETQMKDKLSRLGYREAVLKQDSILGQQDSVVKGHEFHYSEIISGQQSAVSSQSIYSVKDGSGKPLPDEGYRMKNTLGSYIHIHFGSNKNIAEKFITFCKGASWR